jgi:hypothetical protein
MTLAHVIPFHFMSDLPYESPVIPDASLLFPESEDRAPVSAPKRRRHRIGKRELLKNLREENFELHAGIAALNQQILVIERENAVLSAQLAFFLAQCPGSTANPTAPREGP